MADRERNGAYDGVPRWDGNPTTRRRYMGEVRLWALSADLSVSYSLAARLVKSVSGPARRACLTLTDEQLMPKAEVRDE